MEDFENNNLKEIMLTEVVEPPKNSSFSHQEPQNTSDTEESLQDLPDELDILFNSDENPHTPIHNTNIDELIQDALSSEEDSVNIQTLFNDSSTSPIATSLQTPSQSQQQSIESHENNDSIHLALNKLDNLDAMIDTIIAVPPAIDPALVEKVETLDQRVTALETPPSEIKGEYSLQDVYERVLHLEGQYSSTIITINEIQDHLHALLSIPKKVIDIEKYLDSFSPPKPSMENSSPSLFLLEERIHSLESSLESIQHRLSILDKLQAKFDEYDSIFISLQQTSPLSSSEEAFTIKLQQLEQTVEQILEKQLLLEQSTSIQAIQEALLPSIEKEAILAASKIIKEELQTILMWK